MHIVSKVPETKASFQILSSSTDARRRRIIELHHPLIIRLVLLMSVEPHTEEVFDQELMICIGMASTLSSILTT